MGAMDCSGIGILCAIYSIPHYGFWQFLLRVIF